LFSRRKRTCSWRSRVVIGPRVRTPGRVPRAFSRHRPIRPSGGGIPEDTGGAISA
jgi:hypothetical protein